MPGTAVEPVSPSAPAAGAPTGDPAASEERIPDASIPAVAIVEASDRDREDRSSGAVMPDPERAPSGAPEGSVAPIAGDTSEVAANPAAEAVGPETPSIPLDRADGSTADEPRAALGTGATSEGAFAPDPPMSPPFDAAAPPSPPDAAPLPEPTAPPELAASSPGSVAPELDLVPSLPHEPTDVVAAAAPPPPPSGLAVSSAALTNDAWPFFLDATAAGHRGLCISREFPDRMRALLGPRDVSIVWISNSGRAGSVRPSDLEGLMRLIEDAVATQQVRAVYLDHIEYLARVNPVAAVRSCLDRIDAFARTHEARVWVALNPELVTTETGAELSRGFPAAH